MDLTPLPQAVFSVDGDTKADFVKKLHQRVRDNLEKKTEKYKQKADKGRKEMTFEPGEWVWLHMRHERFPNQRKSKLSPRGDGPFRILERVNDNAYKIELPGELNISPTFNVADLYPFNADEAVLRPETSQEGGNDEDIDPILDEKDQQITIPVLRRSPRTRGGVKSVREEFNKSIESLITLMEHEELKEELLTTEITRETPKAPDNDPDFAEAEQGSRGGAQRQLKISSTAFLPVLQGIKETCLFIITKQMGALP